MVDAVLIDIDSAGGRPYAEIKSMLLQYIQ
jgi:hypothetical protein